MIHFIYQKESLTFGLESPMLWSG